jgi:hypothetical protein
VSPRDTTRHIMLLPIVRLLTVMLTALALVPAGAHLFALPNKIGLDSARYFTVQRVYQGWSMFGFVLLGALVAAAFSPDLGRA